MTFRTIVPARKAGPQTPVRVARMALRQNRSQIAILLHQEIVDRLGKGEALQVELGQDRDAGKVRISAARDGFKLQVLVNPNTGEPVGTCRLRLPPDDSKLPSRPASPARYEFEGRALIVMLPDVAAAADANSPEPNEAPDRQPVLAAVNGHVMPPPAGDEDPVEDEDDEDLLADIAKPPAPHKVPPEKRNGNVVTLNGISIDHTVGEEALTYGGKTIEITLRQAKVLTVLGKAMPHPVSHAEMMKRAWVGVAPPTALATLEEITRDMRKPFAEMGLVLTSQKGIGMWLQVKGRAK